MILIYKLLHINSRSPTTTTADVHAATNASTANDAEQHDDVTKYEYDDTIRNDDVKPVRIAASQRDAADSSQGPTSDGCHATTTW